MFEKTIYRWNLSAFLNKLKIFLFLGNHNKHFTLYNESNKTYFEYGMVLLPGKNQ